MCHPAPDAANGFNNQVIEEFRANDGCVTGSLTGTPILLLHHVGARSGIERVTPLAYTPYRAGGYLIVASNGGSPTHPSWYHNLKAHPTTHVEMGRETFTARAEELQGTARAELWPKLLAAVSESPRVRRNDHTTRTAVRAHPRLREALDEPESRVGDFAPSVVDGQGVTAPFDLDDLGDGGVPLLGRWLLPAGAAGSVERCAIEDDAHICDLTVAHRHVLRTWRVENWDRVRSVHDQRGAVVTERANQFRVRDDPTEWLHECPKRIGALDATRGSVANNVIGDVVHRLLEVMPRPSPVVAESDLESILCVWTCRRRHLVLSLLVASRSANRR